MEQPIQTKRNMKRSHIFYALRTACDLVRLGTPPPPPPPTHTHTHTHPPHTLFFFFFWCVCVCVGGAGDVYLGEARRAINTCVERNGGVSYGALGVGGWKGWGVGAPDHLDRLTSQWTQYQCFEPWGVTWNSTAALSSAKWVGLAQR